MSGSFRLARSARSAGRRQCPTALRPPWSGGSVRRRPLDLYTPQPPPRRAQRQPSPSPQGSISAAAASTQPAIRTWPDARSSSQPSSTSSTNTGRYAAGSSSGSQSSNAPSAPSSCPSGPTGCAMSYGQSSSRSTGRLRSGSRSTAIPSPLPRRRRCPSRSTRRRTGSPATGVRRGPSRAGLHRRVHDLAGWGRSDTLPRAQHPPEDLVQDRGR